jgi:Ion transport protein
VKILRILRVTRLLRIIKTSSGIRKLLKTLLISMSNILNVFFLLILLWFVFTIVGESVYSNCGFYDAYDDNANFQSFYIGMILMVRTSTGGAWSDIMHEMRAD